MKKILVCCGSSMVTSTMASRKLEKVLKQKGIDVKLEQCKFSEVPRMVGNFKPDVVVPTGPLSEKDAKGIPVVRGTAFVTGVGEDKVIADIIDVLNK